MRASIVGLVASLLAGCEYTLSLPEPTPTPPVVELAARFDPAACGEITGEVAWVGERLKSEPILEWRLTSNGNKSVLIPNPNAPRYSPDGNLVDAVVWLEGVDPATARPWDRPAGRVTANAEGVFVNGGRNGFVRRGESVTITSEADEPLGVRGRGAAFFTAMLPNRAATTKTFDRPGRVELTSPANLHWAVADLFVCDHPYYATTDSAGRFRLPQVPAGSYQMVVRLPNWIIVGHDRDPETGAVSRRQYAPGVEVRTPVTIVRGQPAHVRLSVPLTAFFGQ